MVWVFAGSVGRSWVVVDAYHFGLSKQGTSDRPSTSCFTLLIEDVVCEEDICACAGAEQRARVSSCALSKPDLLSPWSTERSLQVTAGQRTSQFQLPAVGGAPAQLAAGECAAQAKPRAYPDASWKQDEGASQSITISTCALEASLHFPESKLRF